MVKKEFEYREHSKIIGKHNSVPDSFFNKDELELGIRIEMEHTDDPEVAKKIAKDHLAEFKDYYTRLVKMEKKAEKDSKKEKENNSK
jgi:hypothetical protein